MQSPYLINAQMGGSPLYCINLCALISALWRASLPFFEDFEPIEFRFFKIGSKRLQEASGWARRDPGDATDDRREKLGETQEDQNEPPRHLNEPWEAALQSGHMAAL